MTDDKINEALWRALAVHDRPMRALVAFAAAHSDSKAALELVLGELTDEQRAAIGPLIEAEKTARAEWLKAHPVASSESGGPRA